MPLPRLLRARQSSPWQQLGWMATSVKRCLQRWLPVHVAAAPPRSPRPESEPLAWQERKLPPPASAAAWRRAAQRGPCHSQWMVQAASVAWPRRLHSHSRDFHDRDDKCTQDRACKRALLIMACEGLARSHGSNPTLACLPNKVHERSRISLSLSLSLISLPLDSPVSSPRHTHAWWRDAHSGSGRKRLPKASAAHITPYECE